MKKKASQEKGKDEGPLPEGREVDQVKGKEEK